MVEEPLEVVDLVAEGEVCSSLHAEKVLIMTGRGGFQQSYGPPAAVLGRRYSEWTEGEADNFT